MNHFQGLYKKLAEMPPINHKPEEDLFFDITHSDLVKWLVAQPEIQNWLALEVMRSGAVHFNKETRMWAGGPPTSPVIGIPRNPRPITLTPEDVVQSVRDGMSKAGDIVEACSKKFKVSRRTVMSRLASACDRGLLKRTIPSGSYMLGPAKLPPVETTSP